MEEKLTEINKDLQHSHSELVEVKSMKTNLERKYNKVEKNLIQTQQKVEKMREKNVYIKM